MVFFFLEDRELKRKLVVGKLKFITTSRLDSDKPGLEEANPLRQREIYRARDEVKYQAGLSRHSWQNGAPQHIVQRKAIERDSTSSVLVSRCMVARQPDNGLTPTGNRVFTFTGRSPSLDLWQHVYLSSLLVRKLEKKKMTTNRVQTNLWHVYG